LTDFSVQTLSFTAEDRSWLLSEFEDAYAFSGTIDVSKFTAATHFPNGYIPSGTVLGAVTSGGLLGPYDDTAVDGRQTAVGILLSAVRVWTNPWGGTPLAKVGVAYVAPFIVVSQARLPFNSGNAASGRGYIDANGITDLKLTYFAA